MIDDTELRQAWTNLYYLIRAGSIPWPDYMSLKQIDYLTVCIMRNAYPGKLGEHGRSLVRWCLLDEAFAIHKAKHPDKSINQIYVDLAAHYGCSRSLVKKARQVFGPLREIEDDRPGLIGATEDGLAARDLPHINFKNFPIEK